MSVQVILNFIWGVIIIYTVVSFKDEGLLTDKRVDALLVQ
jgi:hypothetical protein